MIRSHQAGRLRPDDEGTPVTLAGWVATRRDHGGMVFVDLRDASGTVQVVARDPQVAAVAHALRAESCVLVHGTVGRRPAGNENPQLPTGEVEVTADRVQLLSGCDDLPFPVHGVDEVTSPVEESRRWRYRYLDLRRAGPAAAIRTRARLTALIRRVMERHGFVEVETPYLTRSTPEGARDFLVPVRLQPGCWYALPQSPQLFKQLLMVAGLERYYQIARCFRDEDFRADRGPEFTQLDVEMSFLDEGDIEALTEELLATAWAELLDVTLPRPFPRLRYADALARFGSDKPDLRCALELSDLTAVFRDSEVGLLRAAAGQPDGHVGGLLVPGGADLGRRELDRWQEWARGRGAPGLLPVAVQEDGTVRSPVARTLSTADVSGLRAATGARPGDLVFLAAGARPRVQQLLGAARPLIGEQRGLLQRDEWRFLWVVEPPLFEPTADGWTSVHHPFTAPTAEWADRFDADPGAAVARAYDVVCNGMELGGGSIRIHQAAMQQRVFDVLGLGAAEAAAKFGFLLTAFRYGPPPHGGIAFGLDRLAATIVGTDAIREVMAFPKASSGGDPLTGAPTPITAQQRREAGVDATPAEPAGQLPPAGPNRETRAFPRRN